MEILPVILETAAIIVILSLVMVTIRAVRRATGKMNEILREELGPESEPVPPAGSFPRHALAARPRLHTR